MPFGSDSRVSVLAWDCSPQTIHTSLGSLVSGPLAQTSAFLAKVSTTPKSPGPHYQHVICVYLPDVFDKDEVIKVQHFHFQKLEHQNKFIQGDESTST
jgi:hypothetical protein